MALNINDLLKLFEATQKASKIQENVFESLKLGQVDNAIHIVYNGKSFDKFLNENLVPSSKPNVFVNNKSISMASQKFPKDFESKLTALYTEPKSTLIKGIEDFLGSPVTFNGKKITMEKSNLFVSSKLFMINKYLSSNQESIDHQEKINKSVHSETEKHIDDLENWFQSHVLVIPDAQNPSVGEIVSGF